MFLGLKCKVDLTLRHKTDVRIAIFGFVCNKNGFRFWIWTTKVQFFAPNITNENLVIWGAWIQKRRPLFVTNFPLKMVETPVDVLSGIASNLYFKWHPNWHHNQFHVYRHPHYRHQHHHHHFPGCTITGSTVAIRAISQAPRPTWLKNWTFW